MRPGHAGEKPGEAIHRIAKNYGSATPVGVVMAHVMYGLVYSVLT